MMGEQRNAAVAGRVAECPYRHPEGTRCPNCASWPFAKGGAGDFIAELERAKLPRYGISHIGAAIAASIAVWTVIFVYVL